jgi:hypothetical protein
LEAVGPLSAAVCSLSPPTAYGGSSAAYMAAIWAILIEFLSAKMRHQLSIDRQ